MVRGPARMRSLPSRSMQQSSIVGAVCRLRLRRANRRGAKMGYLWRVRLSSFLAGAATASAAGFFLLYKDHLVARAAITQQVEDVKRISEKHYESLNHRISAIENRKESGANKEASD